MEYSNRHNPEDMVFGRVGTPGQLWDSQSRNGDRFHHLVKVLCCIVICGLYARPALVHRLIPRWKRPITKWSLEAYRYITDVPGRPFQELTAFCVVTCCFSKVVLRGNMKDLRHGHGSRHLFA